MFEIIAAFNDNCLHTVGVCISLKVGNEIVIQDLLTDINFVPTSIVDFLSDISHNINGIIIWNGIFSLHKRFSRDITSK